MLQILFIGHNILEEEHTANWSITTFKSSIVDFSCSFSFINFAIFSTLTYKENQQAMNAKRSMGKKGK